MTTTRTKSAAAALAAGILLFTASPAASAMPACNKTK